MKAAQQLKNMFAESKARHEKKVKSLEKQLAQHDFMVVVDAFRLFCLSFEDLYFDEAEERQMQEAHAEQLARKLEKLRSRKRK